MEIKYEYEKVVVQSYESLKMLIIFTILVAGVQCRKFLSFNKMLRH